MTMFSIAARWLPIFMIALLVSERTVAAQDEDYDLAWETSEQVASAPMSMESGFARQWFWPYGDEPLICRFTVRGRNQFISAAVVILAPGGPFSRTVYGYGTVSVTAVMPSIWAGSPGEYYCQGSFTTSSGGAGRAEITARSAPYWGRYFYFFWNYDVIDYWAFDCDIPGMLQQITMSQPAPGWPNVASPPPFAADEGFRFTAQGTGWPLYMNFFLPRGSSPPCIAAQ